MTVSSRSATFASAFALLTTPLLAQQPDPIAPGALGAPQFVANRGQWRAPARFLIEHGAVRTWVTDDAVLVHAERGELGVCVELGWEDAAGTPRGHQELPTRRNWLRSDAQGGQVTDVPAFVQVHQPGLYDHVDLVLRQQDGRVEYDLVLAPGARLDRATVRVRGHEGLWLDADGALVLDTALGELRQTPPVTWATDAAGARTPLPSRFVVLGHDRYGFAVDGWEEALAAGDAVTIDPGLVWGTFLGGSGADPCTKVRGDTNGEVFVCGTTDSTDLPTTVGAFRTATSGNDDAFVARISADGHTLIYCTYLGGTGDEHASALRVQPNSTVAVAGHTNSFNFPLTGNRYQAASAGGIDAFVTILNAAGSAMLYSSYYGGTGDDTDVQLWITPNTDIWLAGRATGSTPTSPNAFQIIGGGQGDVFFGIINRSVGVNPPLRYGSLFGSAGDDLAVHSLHVDANDIATIGFTTASVGLTTTSTAFQSSIVGNTPTGFILCFDPANPVAAATVIYASYYGATGGAVEELHVEQDSNGFFACVATTSSPNWATSPVSSQPAYGGGASDALVSRFNPGVSGSAALLIATYLGGSGAERVEDMNFVYTQGTLDLVSLAGSTTSPNLPVTNSAFQQSPNGGSGSGFCAQIDFRLPGPAQRAFSTYYDGCGPGDEIVRGVDRLPGGDLVVAGESTSSLVPGSAFAFQQLPGGSVDGFVGRLDRIALPAPFSAYGTPCGVAGFVPALAGGTPGRLSQQFSVDMTNLRNNGAGVMALGVNNVDWFGAPLPFDLSFNNMPGCFLHTSSDFFYFFVYSGTSASFGLPVPATMQFHDISVYLQFFMIDLAANPFGMAASNGLQLHLRY
ncbi:MAG: hypothetical protein AB7O97_01690 [Planctomycetota bacterium]